MVIWRGGVIKILSVIKRVKWYFIGRSFLYRMGCEGRRKCCVIEGVLFNERFYL